MGSIAFDNSVISPLIKSGAPSKFNLTDKDKLNARLARHLLDTTKAENVGKKKELETKISIPMPALTECLAGWEVAEQPQALLDLKAIGDPLVYDEGAALVAAKMWAELKAKGMVGDLSKNTSRACVKVDVMIMACCKVHGVQLLYTEDPDFRKMAELDACKGVAVSTLPALSSRRTIAFTDAPPKEVKDEQAQEEDDDEKD